MDWDLCKTFVAVAETRSFAAAARQLRSSHPTVGRKIAELEGQLGIPLFARSNEGLSLTSQGRKFREHVDAMAAAALARRSRGIGDRRAGPRRGQAVDRCDVRLALADAAAWAIPARARPYPDWRSSPIPFRPACAAARPTSCCARWTAVRRI